jgi:hypothetical protein
MSSTSVTERNTSKQSTIEIATCPQDVKAALRLVYRAYLDKGLIRPNPYAMRVTPYHLSPETEVFMASVHGQPACSVSLVRDGKWGLPMESLFREEVSCRRAEGFVCAEASCLADRRKNQTRSFPLVARLMNFTIQCAEYRGIDQLMIAVHPKHSRFYQRFLGFQQITTDERAYDAVCNSPAVALALDIPRLSLDFPAAYKRVFSRPFSDEDLRYRSISDELRDELRMIVEDTYIPENLEVTEKDFSVAELAYT